MQPLVDQLENIWEDDTSKQKSAESSYSQLAPHVISAICGLAGCAHDENLLQTLHYQICLRTRSEVALVRVVALQTLEAVAEKLGDNYGSLLPEAMTFLVESAADENEHVEEQCHKTKATIQRIMGDSMVWTNEMDSD